MATQLAERPSTRKATNRFVMLVDPAERRQWSEKAARAGITTAEFMRRAAAAYEPQDAEAWAEIELMLPAFDQAVESIRSNLAGMKMKLDYALDPQRDVETRERVAKELEHADLSGLRALLGR